MLLATTTSGHELVGSRFHSGDSDVWLEISSVNQSGSFSVTVRCSFIFIQCLSQRRAADFIKSWMFATF